MIRTFIAFAVATAFVATPVLAQERDATRIAVSTEGVDFNNPNEVRSFYRQLKTAAANACDSGYNDLNSRAADRACQQQAIDTAVASVGSPLLTQVASRDAGHAQLAYNDRK